MSSLLNIASLRSRRLLKFCRPYNAYGSSTRWLSQSETNEYKVGDIIHGYKLEQVDYISELNIRPYYLRHESTGAEHLHIHKDDDSNNVFAISLRTTPKNSTGVAHILEHLTLTGSKKYPVREPFFKMTTRSLATFMNAMTGPDFTIYPFSTQNRKDFENLLSVYADAVFFPRLRPLEFRQEGWRLEHERPDKKETPILIRGVVYNEMKGLFSSSSAIYGRQILNRLFPDTTYRFESGGDPEEIPKLSYDELKKFHSLHYHPSNAKFFTYGDIPFDQHLKLINEIVLSKFSQHTQAREQSLVQEQEAWNEPRSVNITCPLDPLSANPDKQTTTSISFMLPTTNTNFDEMFPLQILSSLLIDGPNAPFHKNLIESGLGSDYSPSTGLCSHTKQPYFSIGLQNIKIQDVTKVHEIIEKTFQEVITDGFPTERIDAVLHNIELGLKHISGNFGLHLMFNIESVWNQEGDVINLMKVNEHVKKFRNNLANNERYLGEIISKHFMKNNHRLFLTMSPDADYEARRKERENDLLENMISKLNAVDKQTILYEGMELMKIQDAKEDISVLPCLDPSRDVSRDLAHKTHLEFDSFRGTKIQWCEQPTNEVVYFKALIDAGEKVKEANLVDYLPLFCDVATRLGAGAYNRHELSQREQLTTGGLGVALLINPSLEEFDKYRNEVFIGSHCLERNVASMFDLWTNVFEKIHFQTNKDYLFQLIKASAADLSEGIAHSGHTFAMKRSASSLSNLSSLDERLSGLTFVARMKDMASKEPIESIAAKLQTIAKIAFNPVDIKYAINVEPKSKRYVGDELKKLIEKSQELYQSSSLENGKITDESYEKTKVEDLKFSFATHFVAKSLVTVTKLHEDFPKLAIMSKLISSKYLLREVREKGGAYGAGARLSNSGILSFYSYRDPNTTRTIQVFDNAARWASDADSYTDKDVDESKLGVFQDVDKPVEPGKRGLNYFTQGETDEIRQEYRRRLLDVSRNDVASVARKYLGQEKFGTHII